MVELGLWAVIAVFALDGLMFIALIVIKAIHRARIRRNSQRRDDYIALLSRHLMYDHAVDPIPSNAAEDEAFLDAVIDLRNTVTGNEIAKLSAIAARYDLIGRQRAILDNRFSRVRRLRAAVSLAELGDESSASALMAHIDDPDDEIRIQAARGLARIGHTPAIDRIVDRLEIESEWVRARYGDALAEFGDSASQLLMAYVLVNHEGGVTTAVVQAIRSLGAVGDYTVGPRLAQVLDLSSNREVQVAAAAALGSVGGSFAVPSLVDALSAEDWQVRAQAATSLGEVGDEEIVEDLVEALSDEAWWVRRNAAAALTRLEGGVKTLYRALTSTDPFARDASAEALEDCGELAQARLDHDSGEASNDQLRLLRHMRGVGVPA